MKREAQISNNLVTEIRITIMIIILFTLDEITRVIELNKGNALIKET